MDPLWVSARPASGVVASFSTDRAAHIIAQPIAHISRRRVNDISSTSLNSPSRRVGDEVEYGIAWVRLTAAQEKQDRRRRSHPLFLPRLLFRGTNHDESDNTTSVTFISVGGSTWLFPSCGLDGEGEQD